MLTINMPQTRAANAKGRLKTLKRVFRRPFDTYVGCRPKATHTFPAASRISAMPRATRRNRVRGCATHPTDAPNMGGRQQEAV
ncbi:hypothetical protein HMPREF9123_0129 [Neisseria bacilliformis ATCC BAA-1200]|uniref:Uncharacterized protein n=1 Tax=Neisseria bacilliformis ATCC BAA-1200 TaxID=888742 RepID=F2B8Q4_9NEIS|nr:hypothetical protein HMPREF9123_0129 [Neisseria bacilliformis ATCC BAA-1200]